MNNNGAKDGQHLVQKRQQSYQGQGYDFRAPQESVVLPPAPEVPEASSIRTHQQPSYQHFGQVDNIDERDANDPLCATEYVQDMYHHFRVKEQSTSVRPVYMENQPCINARMRSILIDWLVEVHQNFKFVPETLPPRHDRHVGRHPDPYPKQSQIPASCLCHAPPPTPSCRDLGGFEAL